MRILKETLTHRSVQADLHRPEGFGLRDADGNILFEAPSLQAIRRISRLKRTTTYLPLPPEVYGDEYKTLSAYDIWNQVVIPNIGNRLAADAEKYGWGNKIGMRVEAISVGQTLRKGKITIRSVEDTSWSGIAVEYSTSDTRPKSRIKNIFHPTLKPTINSTLDSYLTNHARDMRDRFNNDPNIFPVLIIYDLHNPRIKPNGELPRNKPDEDKGTWPIIYIEPPSGVLAHILRRDRSPILMMYVLDFPR